MQVKQNEIIANCLMLSMGYSGYAAIDPRWHLDGISSLFNRLYLPEQGEALIFHGGETIVMRPGSAYLIPAGLPLHCRCETSMQKLFFHFNLYKPDHYDFFQGFPQIAHIPLPEHQLQDMLNHYNGSRYLDSTVIRLYLHQIILDIQLKYGLTAEVPNYSEHVQDTISYIQENLSATLRVDDLAKRRFVSRSYLSNLFIKEVGVTPGRYIDDQLVLAAQWHLEQTDETIAKISRDLGFNDQFYFSRRFKQLCGQTPLQYRKYTRHK